MAGLNLRPGGKGLKDLKDITRAFGDVLKKVKEAPAPAPGRVPNAAPPTVKKRRDDRDSFKGVLTMESAARAVEKVLLGEVEPVQGFEDLVHRIEETVFTYLARPLGESDEDQAEAIIAAMKKKVLSQKTPRKTEHNVDIRKRTRD